MKVRVPDDRVMFAQPPIQRIRIGENVRIKNIPYVVMRVGYDLPEQTITRIWVVCRPA